MSRPLAPLPDDAGLVQRAVHSFHSAAAESLGVETATAVAEAIGETNTNYSNCMRGREGSFVRMHRWLTSLEKRGIFLELLLRGKTVEVRPYKP